LLYTENDLNDLKLFIFVVVQILHKLVKTINEKLTKQ